MHPIVVLPETSDNMQDFVFRLVLPCVGKRYSLGIYAAALVMLSRIFSAGIQSHDAMPDDALGRSAKRCVEYSNGNSM